MRASDQPCAAEQANKYEEGRRDGRRGRALGTASTDFQGVALSAL